MEIRGTENVEFNHPQRDIRPAEGDYKPQIESQKGESDKTSVSRSDCDQFIRRASDAPEVNSRAVAEAKRLLAEGKLQDYQAAMRTAQSIIEKGL